jgi:AcrR family transcriptional regulator
LIIISIREKIITIKTTAKMNTERQQEIIEIALDLINEKGIQGLTIKNLLKKLKKEKGTLTLLYSAKDEEYNNAVVLRDFLN